MIRSVQMVLVVGRLYGVCVLIFDVVDDAKYEKEIARAMASNPAASLSSIKGALARKEWASIFIRGTLVLCGLGFVLRWWRF